MTRPRKGAAPADRAPTEDEIRADLEALVGQLRELSQGRHTRALMSAYVEMYARVVSQCISREEDLESALEFFQRHVRGWWLADHGGQYRIS